MTDPLDNPSPPGKHRETICALLTPRGRGAVAVIAVVGPNAELVLEVQFQAANRKMLSQNASRKIIYGLWKATGEDVVVFRRGKNRFEVHCHGGSSAPTAILHSLSAAEVRLLSASQFARRFENPWKVSGQEALAQATTTRTAEHLLRQLDVLPDAIAKIESLIESNTMPTAISQIESILKWSRFGVHLTQPRCIVLCGQPNVGKSSLANAIIGFERAIVHCLPGTTRDVVSQLTAIDGWPVELKDTAGLRDPADTIEAIGIEKAKSQIEAADVRVCVFDVTSQWSESDTQILRSVDPHLIVHNKLDLAPASVASPPDRPEGLLTSAESGLGVPELMRAISLLLVPVIPNPNQPIPVTPAQAEQLQSVLDFLKSGDRSSAIQLIRNSVSDLNQPDSNPTQF